MTELEKLIVRWPEGGIQEFENIKPGHYYRIVQDVETAQVWPVPPSTNALTPAPTPGPCAGTQANLALSVPMPLPALGYETFEGDKASLRDLRGRPVVVCLWASWCAPCLAELSELARREKEIRAAGLEIVALSVDGLGDDRTSPRAAQRVLTKSRFPFLAGQATAGLVEKIHFVHRNIFHSPQDLPVPTSLLIDPAGRLVAVYRGRVEVERLVADMGMLSQGNDKPQFAGHWFSLPKDPPLSPLVGELFKRGYISEAIEYLADNKARIRKEEDYEKLLNKAGTEKMRHGKIRSAAVYFQEAIDVNPDYSLALNNLAWILATYSGEGLRNGAKAVDYAQRAVRLAPNPRPDVLGTLAAAYAEAGRFEEAVVTAEKALQLARETGAKGLEKGLQQEIVLYLTQQPYRTE